MRPAMGAARFRKYAPRSRSITATRSPASSRTNVALVATDGHARVLLDHALLDDAPFANDAYT